MMHGKEEINFSSQMCYSNDVYLKSYAIYNTSIAYDKKHTCTLTLIHTKTQHAKTH